MPVARNPTAESPRDHVAEQYRPHEPGEQPERRRPVLVGLRRLLEFEPADDDVGQRGPEREKNTAPQRQVTLEVDALDA